MSWSNSQQLHILFLGCVKYSVLQYYSVKFDENCSCEYHYNGREYITQFIPPNKSVTWV